MNPRTNTSDRSKRPLNAAKLDELALAYVARFATSKGKLTRYLSRKVAESKWDDDENSAEIVAAVVMRMENMRYLDDQHYAQMKSGAMMRRGLGPSRVQAQLQFDGIAEADRSEAMENQDDEIIMAAVRFAQRRRAGPFALNMLDDRAAREKLVGAFIRAGHSQGLARRLLAMEPVDYPQLEEIAEQLADI